jgi:hypothetical protein
VVMLVVEVVEQELLVQLLVVIQVEQVEMV